MSAPRDARPRRPWRQRLLISANVLAIVAASVTTGVLAYGNTNLSHVPRIVVSDDLAHEELEEGDPVNILVVGIDNAEGLDEDDPARQRSAGDLKGQHTDSIMLLRLDPRAGTIQTLSFPRDLWVTIADTGIQDRINAALPTGGEGRLIRTITQEFGITPHHYMQVDFASFGQLIEVIGGIPVQFPHPVRSRGTNDRGRVQALTEIDIPTAGCWTLGPRQALAFSRERKGYQVQDADGDWHVDPDGDFSRIARQQLLLRLAMEQAISKGARNPNTLRRLVETGAGIVQLDDVLTPGYLVDLALHFRDFNPDELQTFELEVSDGREGGAQILYLDEEASEPALAVFRGVAAVGSVVAENVKVQVLNGTGIAGQGGDVTDELVEAGFEAIVPEDADEEDKGQPTTIRYAEGNEAEAHLLALHVAGPVRYEADPTLAELDMVVLVTGSDWEGVAPTPRAADEVDGPTTTTTTTTTTPLSGTTPEGGESEGEPSEEAKNDPDDPAFYLPEAPPAGASCTPTQ